MSYLCLDTSAYSHFKAGNQQSKEIISSSKSIGVPAVVLGELRSGFLMGNKAQKNETELIEFISNSYVTVFDVDEETSKIYAEIVFDLKKAGTPIPTNDIWIAAVSLQNGATLLTFDKQFEYVKRLGVHLLHAH